MLIRKELLIPFILLVIVGALSFYTTFKYLGDYLHYNNLQKNGIVTLAVIIDKGIYEDGSIIYPENTVASDSHVLKLRYLSNSSNDNICEAVVSKNIYDRFKLKNEIRVLHESSAARCYLPQNLKGLYIISIAGLSFGVIFLLIFLLLAIYIYKSFRKVRSPIKLSTEISVAKDKIICPECLIEMEEGYIPGVGGINWRKRKDPIGLPNMLTGLPGTVFWFKRPILHAFKCKKCSVVIFKYGK